MADIVDLSSLIRRDDNLVGLEDLDDASDDAVARADDGTGHLTFGASDEGLLDFGAPPHRGARPRFDATLDWTNQELADLYRVQRLLGQAGIGVDTDRGVSDEGDPWFVFLDAHGEVFVHLSRIDGLYILDSAVQDGVVTGRCFATLIESFAGRAEAAAAVRPDGANVISMNRRGKIVLHPGAALAALVWSILLVSDELIFLEQPRPDSDPAGSDDMPRVVEGDTESPTQAATGPEAGAEIDADGAHDAFSELFVDQAQAATFLSNAVAGREGAERVGPADMRDSAGLHAATGSGGASVGNALTMMGLGLTALAAAYGINRNQLAEEPAPDEAAEVTTVADDADSDATKALDPTRDIARADIEQAASGRIFGDDAHAAELSDGAGDDPEALATEVAAAKAAEAIAADLAVEDVASGAARPSDQAVELVTSMEPTPQSASPKTVESVDAARAAQPPADMATRLTQILETVGLDDLLGSDGTSFSMASNRMLESADDFFRLVDDAVLVVSEAGLVASPDDNVALGVSRDMSATDLHQPLLDPVQLPDAPLEIPLPALEFAEFTDDVRNYIDHVILNSEVEVIELDNQILLIDTKALNDSGGEAFALTWSLDEDTTVSTIGIKSDFEAFDLIA